MKSSLTELFRGKSVSLLGAGVSNMPLAELAAKYSSRLTVRDRKSPDELGERADILNKLGARLITGDCYLAGIDEDMVFRSPGMRPDLPELTDAVRRGTVLTSEMEEFLKLSPCPVYAVTGSDGKTTTTTLTSLMLASAVGKEHTFLGGNIGEPLLHRYPMIGENDAVAVELSSFQLMTVDSSVCVAAITNITPNHLNWHTSMDEYIEAKARILRHARRAVLNYDNDITRRLADTAARDIPVTYFSLSPIPKASLRSADSAVWLDDDGTIRSYFPDEGERVIMSRTDIRLPGLHNTANYMTAAAIVHGIAGAEGIREVARTFGGVEHRLEFVREKDGVTYINGSIDSSPTRTAAALSAISDRPVVLIAGGYDKHIPYGPLADAVFSSTVHTIVLTGDTAELIETALLENEKYKSAADRGFKIIRNPDFDGAVSDAARAASSGDTVILSPASASFDHFRDFAERGNHFKEIIRKL